MVRKEEDEVHLMDDFFHESSYSNLHSNPLDLLEDRVLRVHRVWWPPESQTVKDLEKLSPATDAPHPALWESYR